MRVVDLQHLEPMFAKFEEKLFYTINWLGIVLMGSRKGPSVLSVNIEYAYTHIAGIAVGLSSNCYISRRASTKIYDNGKIEETEMISDTAKFLDAVKEVVEIAEKNNIPGQIHHVKVCKRNFSQEVMDKFFHIVYGARKRGIDILMEVYPYKASWIGVDALMPPSWAREGGIEKIEKRLKDKSLISKIQHNTYKLRNWNSEDNIIKDSKDIIVIGIARYKKFIGKSLFEISKIMGKNPFEVAIELIKLSYCQASVVYLSLREEDVIQFLKCPWQ